jgi:hypothetical protein
MPGSAALLVCCLSGVAGAAVPTNQLPITLQGGHLVVVRGSIGPLHDLSLVIDTGAARSVVGAHVASQLGLSRRPAHLSAFGRSLDADETVLPDIRFGPVKVISPCVLVANTGALEASLRLEHLDAIVGLDLLALSDFGIDYENLRLEFSTLRRTLNVVPLVPHPFLVMVRARVGSESLPLAIDTGLEALVLFRGRSRATSTGGDLIRVTDLAGNASATVVPLKQLRLGSWQARRTPGLVMDVGEDWEGAGGLLGVAVLRARYVQFDFTHRRLGWTP